MKSQWEFGDLFAQPSARKVLSVSELTQTIRRLLEKEVGLVWVSGEITNWRLQSSGHAYFGIKDANAQLSCVLFRGEARGVNRGALRDGQKVVAQGELSVYEPRGQYQLKVVAIELQGVGALQIAFERLKEKLLAEGLFATERKRALPRYPRRLGVATSLTGAALRDVAHVIQRRHPGLGLVVAQCRVQGQGAAEEIAAAIRLLNEWAAKPAAEPKKRGKKGGAGAGPVPESPNLDVILVTRGGGSLEDLWAFNEEAVARAIFESRIPVVSAVGHEIDFTISDFVADFRAATPSAAAEVITEGFFSSREFVRRARERLGQLAWDRVEREWETFQQLGRRLARAHPKKRWQEQGQYVDDLSSRLSRRLREGYRRQMDRWRNLGQRLARSKPSQGLQRRRLLLDGLRDRLREEMKTRLEAKRNRLTRAVESLRLLSPLSVLERGFSITLDAETGRIIREPNQVRTGQRLRTRVSGGDIISSVEAEHPGPRMPERGAGEEATI